ncbi:hypothetical protein [Pelagicoccus sp. SDUM812002]|uniref:hypothetical protein n=1 Tax=Pelagicoccus sp. SDUM812002 TaxID=3041266 RepID=UPI00280FEB2C|nr:hypothetical protein [Pelagicoccus sp. SDUM812002]MDQ8187556.1 hypothetical protein [Pelagicoccus sp. SDUM812002]
MNTQLLALALAGTATLVSNLSARPYGPPPPDPETVVVEMFTDYDADESNTLNQEELVAALTGIREKHRAARQADRPRMSRNGPESEPPANRPSKPGNGKRRGPPPAEEIAPGLISDFDASGDSELDTEELLEAIKFMRERGRP